MSDEYQYYDTNAWLRRISFDLERIADALEGLLARQEAKEERERDPR